MEMEVEEVEAAEDEKAGPAAGEKRGSAEAPGAAPAASGHYELPWWAAKAARPAPGSGGCEGARATIKRDRARGWRKDGGRAAIGSERDGRRGLLWRSLWSERGAGRAVGGKVGARAARWGL